MIANIIAYTIVAAFTLPGFVGLTASIIVAYTGDTKKSGDGFAASLIMLGVGLFFAWMWGI